MDASRGFTLEVQLADELPNMFTTFKKDEHKKQLMHT